MRAFLVLCALCVCRAHTELRPRSRPVRAAEALPLQAVRKAVSAGPRMAISGVGWSRGSLTARVRSQLSRLRRIGGRLSAPAPTRHPDGSPIVGGSRYGGASPHFAAAVTGGFASSGAAARGKPAGKLRILFLISDTGGGHRASAQALEAALQELYPGEFEFIVLDIWTLHSRWPYNKCVPGYRFLAKHPMAWRLIWFYSVFFPTRQLTTMTVKRLGVVGRFKEAIAAFEPDVVVSMHPLTQDLPLDALEQLGGGQRKVMLPTTDRQTDLQLHSPFSCFSRATLSPSTRVLGAAVHARAHR